MIDINVYGGFFFDSDINRFSDCDGKIIHNIHEFLQPWVVEAWKKYCYLNDESYQKVKGINGWIDLYYMNNHLEREFFKFIHQHTSIFPKED